MFTIKIKIIKIVSLKNRIAELTKENLQSQRQTIRMIQQKMNTLTR